MKYTLDESLIELGIKVDPSIRNTMGSEIRRFDVCIVCATFEEAKPFLDGLMGISFEDRYDGQLKYHHKFANMKKSRGKQLTLHLSWLPRYGPPNMAAHLEKIMRHQPQIVIMTGVCAGDPKHVKLGDLVVADKTFGYESERIVEDGYGRDVLQRSTETHQIDSTILRFLRNFDEWKSRVRVIKGGSQIECRISPMASGSSVLKNNPFTDIQLPVRDAMAIEMEGNAMGSVMIESYPDKKWFIVKGVTSYTGGEKDEDHHYDDGEEDEDHHYDDEEEDEDYHELASTASASYALSFIEDYDITSVPSVEETRSKSKEKVYKDIVKSAKRGADLSKLIKAVENGDMDINEFWDACYEGGVMKEKLDEFIEKDGASSATQLG
jgi:nucleoside phosphorylase